MTRAVPQTAPIPVLTRRTIPGLLNSPQIRQKITSATEDAVLRASNGPNRRDSSSTVGGSARGYQEFFASLAAWPSRLLGPAESLARLHIYASSSRSENALSCRRQGHRARITARFRGACGLRLRTGGHLLLGDVRGRSILRQRSLLLCRIVGA